MKIIKLIAIALLVALVILQFFQPEKNISKIVPKTDIVALTQMPESVAATLHTACYDCHSNNTNYPWYNNIAPLSYWMDEHVKDGKKHLNFSHWGNYSLKKQLHKLEETVEEINEGKMPLDSYVWIHNEAKLTALQKEEIEQWVAEYTSLNQIEE
ncbi:heme-binding domain-containing protein [Gillisia sp. M10.2A]|uniref:Heme-binding domain-containing protein n=1 Tax=Gillisia lutea TaxID=2909668 RepID=A0ABS9EIZ1_9FLAO|nr:heme-binding domain-containing protein [Gillisia lutea]MCF4102820.1 heme-binding domain-containing protein [Gillisia lutea]